MDTCTNTDSPSTSGQGSLLVSGSQSMTDAEVQSLFLCKEDVILQIDPFVVSATLRRKYPRRFESVHKKINTLALTTDRRYVSEVLISHLPQNIAYRTSCLFLKNVVIKD
ncbi:hypothetical protein MAR_023609 [Mya arenaria]|uniref:Uncharacterized protein n=1 Tax=Mya arenaria TaxID=6604 RepID=A0ABY7DQR9_MYAAR|nr:hypothetical protein MAR_023609 [Mya arenaria]